MKTTMNNYKKTYILAKAHLEALEAEENRIGYEYLTKNNIVNSDGTNPERLWCIDDDEVFIKANQEVSEIIVSSGLENELNEARALLKTAEDKLIKFCLCLCPTKEREILERAAKNNWSTRQKIIALALKLDTSTILR